MASRSSNRMQTLEILVEELMKDQPEPAVIKKLMAKSGLTYKEDPIENINAVLKALHPPQVEVSKGKEL